jgi:hypothetical protein
MRPRETCEGSRGPLPHLNQPQNLSNDWGPPHCERIDGIVALIMALDLASRHVPGRSIYETAGMPVL